CRVPHLGRGTEEGALKEPLARSIGFYVVDASKPAEDFRRYFRVNRLAHDALSQGGDSLTAFLSDRPLNPPGEIALHAILKRLIPCSSEDRVHFFEDMVEGTVGCS